MKIKNFLLAGIAGGAAYYLLGWLFYGMLFKEYFGGGDPNMTFITLGCFSFGFMFSYALVNLGNFTTLASGLKVGAILGFFFALTADFFMEAHSSMGSCEKLCADIAISIVCSAVVGGIIAAVNGALSKPTAA